MAAGSGRVRVYTCVLLIVCFLVLGTDRGSRPSVNYSREGSVMRVGGDGSG